MEANREMALEALSEHFGDRFRRYSRSGDDTVVASVLPLNVDDVRRVSQVAARCLLPLLPVGSGTAPGDGPEERNAIEVRFDMMRGINVPEKDEGWVEAEPGVTWLQLDNELRRRHRGLAVYPTSAPRATVGGWLAIDGVGVGSFEFGRLYGNVLSATVVGRGGGLREIGSDELGYYFGPGRASGVVVRARLRTRPGGEDRVLAAAFEDARGLAGAVGDLASSDAPLWHLSFVSPVMAAARGLRARYILIGAYPKARDGEEWWELRRRVLKAHGATELDTLEAWRVWGERFYPVAPAHPTPHVARRYSSVDGLLGELEAARPEDAFQGTVSRSGEVMLLELDGG